MSQTLTPPRGRMCALEIAFIGLFGLWTFSLGAGARVEGASKPGAKKAGTGTGTVAATPPEKPYMFVPDGVRNPFELPTTKGPSAQRDEAVRTRAEQYKDVADAKAFLAYMEEMVARNMGQGDIKGALGAAREQVQNIQETLKGEFDYDPCDSHARELLRAARAIVARVELAGKLALAGKLVTEMEASRKKGEYEKVEAAHKEVLQLLSAVDQCDDHTLKAQARTLRGKVQVVVESVRAQLIALRFKRVESTLADVERFIRANKIEEAKAKQAFVQEQLALIPYADPPVRKRRRQMMDRSEALKQRIEDLLRRAAVQKEFEKLPIAVSAVAVPGAAIINARAVKVGEVFSVGEDPIKLTDVSEQGVTLLFEEEQFLKPLAR